MGSIIHDRHAQRIHVLDQRFYTNDMEHYFPGSTTILEAYPKGAWYAKWLKEQGENADKIRDDAGEIGSIVHEATEGIDKGLSIFWSDNSGKPFFTLEQWQMILNYVDFKKKVNPTIIANEQVFCSSELGYGGTLDRVMEFDGIRWLIDIKTSNQISDTYILQLASYAMLWNEKNPETPIEDIGVLWLKSQIKTDKIAPEKCIWQGRPHNNPKGWQVVTFDETYQEAFKDFEHVKAIWKRANPNYKPLNLIYPDVITP